MRPVTVSVTGTGTGASSLVIIDQYLGPTNIGLGVKVTGAGTYTVQHTFDDVFATTFDAATATYYSHSSLSGVGTNADGNYAFPPRGVRVFKTAGTGTVALTLTQSGR